MDGRLGRGIPRPHQRGGVGLGLDAFGVVEQGMVVRVQTPLYPCSECGEEHERHTLVADGMQLICQDCWTAGFEERAEPA